MLKLIVVMLKLNMLLQPLLSKPIDIYLIRHGETWNNAGISERGIPANMFIQGGDADEDLHNLCPSGKKQARDVDLFLKERFPNLKSDENLYRYKMNN